MQYTVAFIAVLAVVVFLNLFLLLALKQIAAKADGQIRERFLNELSVFDRLYEEKAQRLAEIKKETEKYAGNLFTKQETEPPPAVTAVRAPRAVDIPVARVANRGFLEAYQYVRRSFDLDKDAVVAEVSKQLREKKPEQERRRHAVDGILVKLPLETAFDLSTLEPGDQEGILKEVLEPEECNVLEEYLEQEGQMDAIQFRERLISESRILDDSLVVYTSDSSYQPKERGIQVVHDSQICEGLKIVCGSRLHDYSI